MPNEGDLGSAYEEAERNNAIQAARAGAAASRGLKPRGRCHFCEEKLDDLKKVFCDEDCRDDYDYEKQRRSANSV